MRLVLFAAGTAVLVFLAAFCWLYFYSGGLPDISALAQYAPTTVTQVSDRCLGASVAVPFEAIGGNVRDAIRAAEANEGDPGVLSEIFRVNFTAEPALHRVSLPVVVGRSLFCSPSKMLRRHFDELRAAVQLDRRFSRPQLLTIYANRVFLGPHVLGVHDGAHFYFQKNSADLTISEAALLVGIARGPSWLSPVKHPDRALRRRNEVIDAMVENGSITAAEAQAAKNAPLGVAISATTAAAPLRIPDAYLLTLAVHKSFDREDHSNCA